MNNVPYNTTDGKSFPSFKEAAEYAKQHAGVTFSRAENGRAFAKAPKASVNAEVEELRAAITKLNAVIDAQNARIEALETKRRARKAA